MDEYVHMQLKNHKQYGRKILFVMVTCTNFNCNEVMMKEMIEKYKKYLDENPGISLIFDSRQVKSVSPQTAWKGANLICKLNGIAKKNVNCSCIIMDNKILRDLFNTITKVHQVVVPYKIVATNQEAMDYVISQFKEN